MRGIRTSGLIAAQGLGLRVRQRFAILVPNAAQGIICRIRAQRLLVCRFADLQPLYWDYRIPSKMQLKLAAAITSS